MTSLATSRTGLTHWTMVCRMDECSEGRRHGWQLQADWPRPCDRRRTALQPRWPPRPLPQRGPSARRYSARMLAEIGPLDFPLNDGELPPCSTRVRKPAAAITLPRTAGSGRPLHDSRKAAGAVRFLRADVRPIGAAAGLASAAWYDRPLALFVSFPQQASCSWLWNRSWDSTPTTSRG